MSITLQRSVLIHCIGQVILLQLYMEIAHVNVSDIVLLLQTFIQ